MPDDNSRRSEVIPTDISTSPSTPIIDTSLIPQHVAEDIGKSGYEAFLSFKRSLINNPVAARRFQERVAEYKKRKAQKGGSM